MIFNSLTFVVFFAVVLGAYWALRSWSARKNLLLVASYVFYGAWNPPFVLLLMLSTLIDYVAGARMAAETRPAARKTWLALSLIANLGLLGYFKYGNFLLENFQALLALGGITYVVPKLSIVLPVGISFYTFQTLSYSLDIYRGHLQPARSLRDFALYVTFFPQLVAGPIVRAVDFLPQMVRERTAQTGRLSWGLFLMTLGLFQKVVLADVLLSGAADKVFGFQGPLASLDAWAGVMAFSGQIFFDFAGYSTCAIGAALCFGFSMGDNFRAPYAAVGFSDFWRRWHISLSTFLRDYLYIPLGGNRAGLARALLNLLIVMFLGGLWHGAAWTFVAWGVVHGLCLVIERVLAAVFKPARWTDSLAVQVALGLVTFVVVSFAWVFFRVQDFGAAIRVLLALVGGLPIAGEAVLPMREIVQVALVIGGLLGAHWTLRHTTIEQFVSRTPRWALTGAWSLMLFTLILTQGNGNAFIYFQF
ncbi:MAG: membrane-bound O-acyltransferase family protein [Opitutus sp.]|nr:membrane-bound O-acyltransferase family protein [Opitutus sp.]